MTDPSLDAPITLDQLRVFLCVIEEGSFSKAAKRLRRVQSAISYSVANLERLLDLELFDRSGRMPVLTEAGRALYADARAVTDRVDLLHARARSIASGVEARVSLAVDALYPMEALVEALRAFSERFETVDLHLRTEALGAVSQLLTDGVCQVGISVELDPFPRELTTRALTTIPMVPVCGKDHALAQRDGAVPVETIAEDVQIVVTDRSPLTEGRDRGVLSERTWRVADLGAKREILLASFGWGLMPRHLVRDDLAAGRLVSLTIAGWDAPAAVPLLAVHRTADPPGPAASWLLGELRARCAPALTSDASAFANHGDTNEN